MAWENDWEKTRKWGRLKYSLLHGFSFAILFSILMFAWDSFDGKEFSLGETAFMMFWNFILMGLIYYFLLWPHSERRYKKKKHAEHQP